MPDSNQNFADHLRTVLTQDGPRLRWVDIPTNIGWVGCPSCSLPFMPGGKLLFDTQTRQGACQDCGEWGVRKLNGEESEEEELPY